MITLVTLKDPGIYLRLCEREHEMYALPENLLNSTYFHINLRINNFCFVILLQNIVLPQMRYYSNKTEQLWWKGNIKFIVPTKLYAKVLQFYGTGGRELKLWLKTESNNVDHLKLRNWSSWNTTLSIFMYINLRHYNPRTIPATLYAKKYDRYSEQLPFTC